jgi:hypothetical protein
MDTPPAPTPLARSFIVLAALLQGLLLYLAQTGIEHDWWPFSHLGGRVCWYTLVLTIPTLMTLTVVRLGDTRFWQHVAAATAAFAMLAAWATWSATGAPDLRADQVLAPFGFTLALALFVALPYLQCRLQHGGWRAPYSDLFEWAWQNGLVLILTAVFTGLCWGVLQLCAALFGLIEIEFFKELFRRPAFVYLATGVMVGLGILIARSQPQAVRVARQILLAIFKGLLPMLAVVALMFLVSLPFTGLEPLWKTRFASGTLFCLLALLVLFTNAVFQDGRGARPYPVALRRIVEAALVAMPVFALIALHAVWLRIAQYGWTQDRYWAALVGLVLLGYALGYAASVVRRGTTWLAWLPRSNVAISLAILALVAASNSPLLDPHRLAVASQVARLDAEAPGDSVARHLRFDSGRRGYLALVEARDVAPADSALRSQLARTLEERLPDWERRGRGAPEVEPTLAEARARLPHGGPGAVPDDFLQALIGRSIEGAECVRPGADCVVLTQDLDADGESEQVVCNLSNKHWVSCWLSWRKEGRWTAAGTATVSPGPAAANLLAALRAGRVQVRPARWQVLAVGSDEFRFQHD